MPCRFSSSRVFASDRVPAHGRPACRSLPGVASIRYPMQRAAPPYSCFTLLPCRESENRRAQRHVYWQSYLRHFSLRAPSLRTSVGGLKKDGGGISQSSRSPKRLRTPRATPPSSPSYLVVCRGASPLLSIPTLDKRSLCAAIVRFELESTSTLPRPCTFLRDNYFTEVGRRRTDKVSARTALSSAQERTFPSEKRIIGSRSLSTTNPMVDLNLRPHSTFLISRSIEHPHR
jgi:hypothetical protein